MTYFSSDAGIEWEWTILRTAPTAFFTTPDMYLVRLEKKMTSPYRSWLHNWYRLWSFCSQLRFSCEELYDGDSPDWDWKSNWEELHLRTHFSAVPVSWTLLSEHYGEGERNIPESLRNNKLFINPSQQSSLYHNLTKYSLFLREANLADALKHLNCETEESNMEYRHCQIDIPKVTDLEWYHFVLKLCT